MLKSVQVSSGQPDSKCTSLSLIIFAESHSAIAEGRKGEGEEAAAAVVLTLAGADASRTLMCKSGLSFLLPFSAAQLLRICGVRLKTCTSQSDQ